MNFRTAIRDDADDELDEDSGDSMADGKDESKPGRRLVPLSAMFKPMTDIDVGAAMAASSPNNSQLTTPDDMTSAYAQPLSVEARLPGRFGLQQLQVTASRRPLYFEETDRERRGIGQGCATTAVSAARFFATSIALPFKMIATPPGTLVPLVGSSFR